METYIILIIAIANMFGIIGTWTTDSRGKNFVLGYAAGFIFGPIGLLALALSFPKKRL